VELGLSLDVYVYRRTLQVIGFQQPLHFFNVFELKGVDHFQTAQAFDLGGKFNFLGSAALYAVNCETITPLPHYR